MNKNILTTAVISGVTGAVFGGIVTYVTVNKALRKRYEDWANSEIDSVKARYALMHKDTEQLDILAMAENPSPEIQAAVAKGLEIMQQMGYSEAQPVEKPKHKEEEADDRFPGTVSLFDQGYSADDVPESDEPDDEDIHPSYKVIEGEPFLITETDFFENGPGYELDTLTYYAVDESLCDENNALIPRVDETVGERHLHMFQEGNGAKTSLYIQNDDQQTLYEVILDNRSYAAVVLGMDEADLGIKAPKEKPKKMKKVDH
jgi:hypothetical protein